MCERKDHQAIRITALSAGVYRLQRGKDKLGYAKPLGLFRKQGIKPQVGDYVEVQLSQDPDIAYQIIQILPQKNSLIRPSLANIDCLFIFTSLKQPYADWLLLDKLILMAKHLHLEIVLVFSKADLLNLEEEIGIQEVLSLYANKVDYLCIKNKNDFRFYQNNVSNYFELLRENPLGFDETIQDFLKDKTIAFAGPSGAGKSTFFNAFLGQEVMLTGEVSSKIERGKHTTRSVELYPCQLAKSFFYLVDTPGFSALSLADVGVTEEDFRMAYPNYALWGQTCKYQGCRHLCEQDCALIERSKSFTLAEQAMYERYVFLRQGLIQEQKKLVFIQKNSKKRKK